MRRLAKRVLEFSLTHSGFASIRSHLARGRVLILAYHNIVPDEDPPVGDSSLHLRLSDFRAQLDALQRWFEVVPVQEIGRADPPRGRGFAALTFDDGYRGAIQLGLQEIESRQLPATVFVCPGMLGEGGFWWDRVSDPHTGSVRPDIRARALDRFKGQNRQILNWARAEGLPLQSLPPLYMPASEEELRRASVRSGVTFGSHSWSHANLAALSKKELEEEIVRAQEWMEGLPSSSPEIFSFPYGLWNQEAQEALRNAGIPWALGIRGGLARARDLGGRSLELPRMNIPRGLSEDGFQARICGVWPR